jgi:hypothetical protein
MWAAVGVIATAISGAIGIIAASYFGYLQVMALVQLNRKGFSATIGHLL